MGFAVWKTFVKTRQIIRIINLSKHYACRPSELLNIPDEYTAYCFDEVCAEIVLTMTDEKEPKEPKFDVPHKHYKSFTEFYKQFE